MSLINSEFTFAERNKIWSIVRKFKCSVSQAEKIYKDTITRG